MASSSSSDAGASSLSLGNAKPVVSKREIPVLQILAAAADGDIPLARKMVERLHRTGKGMEEALAALKDPRFRSRGPLHLAAWSGKLDMCKFLIKDLHLDANAVDGDGLTPLIFAIYGSGSIATVRLLLDRGADPDRKYRNGLTPLHNAVFKDSYEIAELLLSRGAYVDPIFEKGAPLHVAAEAGHARMLELLLRHGADPNRVLRLFYKPLTVALFSSSLECVELLIKAGADVNAGRPITPLVVAASSGLTDCIKCLLEAGADANIPDEIGRVPVEIAAIQGWKECVVILFPLTTPVAGYADWSINGIIQHVLFGSTKLQGKNDVTLKAQGDAKFEEKEYGHASALYTLAMNTDPDDPALYAKRILCWLRTGEKEKAFDDANTYKNMELDLSNSCYEQGAALILTKDYGQACKALMTGLNLDFGST